MNKGRKKIRKAIIAKDYPLGETLIGRIQDKFCEDGWISICSDRIFCALINKSNTSHEMRSYSWGLHYDSYSHRINELSDGTFLRYDLQPQKGIYPFVYVIPAKGCYSEEVVLCEDFISLYNLHRRIDRKDAYTFVQIDDNGNEIEVVRVENRNVEVSYHYLMEYIAIRELNFIVFFDLQSDAVSKSYEQLGITPLSNAIVKTSEVCFNFTHIKSAFNKDSSSGWIVGKCLYRCDKNDINHLWNPTIEEYEVFIVGGDKKGNLIRSTCKDEELSNRFVTRPNSYSTLTPVYFKATVLDKYYNAPSVYSVEDGYVQSTEWGLHLDNDRNDGYVVALLGDLGKLPYSEQKYWKQYNQKPPKNASLSRTAYTRWELGCPCNPSVAKDLMFKYAYRNLNIRWKEKYGWVLFRELAEGDKKYFYTLHSLTSRENDLDFDRQILALCKLMVDSLNHDGLRSLIDEKDAEVLAYAKECTKTGNPKDASGMSLFKLFLISNKMSDEEIIPTLRNLYDMRSQKVAHRLTSKEKKIRELFEFFDLYKQSTQEALNNILDKLVCWMDNQAIC